MVDTSESVKLEIVRLANGRFSVVPEGEAALPEADGEFATQQEAEDWMFQRTQQLDARANDLGVITPGGGQGVR